MTILLEVLLGATSSLVLIAAAVLFTEVLFAATSRAAKVPAHSLRPRIAILMPAHDEASGIAATLRSLVPQLLPSDRLIVIADNCSDKTAEVAASEGAEVISRTDSSRRGKGYALDFGLRHLRADAPDIVMIIDADCNVEPGAVDRLVRTCAFTGAPVQALYLTRTQQDAGLRARIAEFAWIVRNQVRPLGLRHVGLPCQLMGTGMAFPWACLNAVELASGHIVEDLKLGIDLALAGRPPVFCPEALVTSQFPSSDSGLQGQRTRWEHGHLGIILAEVPRLLAKSVRSLNISLLAMALDLSVPPLALLALLVLALSGANAVFFLVTRTWLPLSLTATAAVLLAFSVALAWSVFGRGVISLRSLAAAPAYALWKFPMYVKFLTARQSDWIRSKRDGS